MRKISIVLVMLLTIALLFSACSENKPSQGNTGNDEPQVSATSNSEPYTIKFAFVALDRIPTDLIRVQDEMSEKCVEKINARVEFLPLTMANYQQQMNLMMSSGEKLDLIIELGQYLSGDAAKNRLIVLDDLIEQYGPDVKRNLGDYLKAGQINGKTYAMPAIRNMGNAYGLLIRKDLADKYNIDVDSIKTIEDCENVFKILKENEPNMYATMSSTGTTSVYDSAFNHFDPLGDGLGVLMDLDSTKVVNKYEDPQYIEDIKTIRRWYQEGYIPKDLHTMTEGGGSIIKAGKVASLFSNIKPGFDQQLSNTAGTQMVMAQIIEPFATSQAVAAWSMAIPINCKDQVSTMKFVNLMYSDPEIINLIDWGIEGVHYVKQDDGTISYPEGVDASNTGWGLNMNFQFGNQLLSHVWKGDSPDLYKNLLAFNNSAKLSKAFGFSFDGSDLKTEYASLTNVVNQYKLALEDGVLDPDEILPKFNKALYDAGLEKYIAEKQKQYDAWLAAQ